MSFVVPLLAFAAARAARLDYSGPTMLSAVIPVLNEAESLAALCGELADVAQQQAYDLEIIFVETARPTARGT